MYNDTPTPQQLADKLKADERVGASLAARWGEFFSNAQDKQSQVIDTLRQQRETRDAQR